MPNNFLKDIQIAWEKVLEGFQDALVASRKIAKFSGDAKLMERSNNVLWLPQPYILQSYDGSDQTGNFQDKTQLSVPATIGFRKVVPFRMSDTELLDDLQEGRLGKAAYERLASDINVAVMTVASQEGTIVITKSTAASDYQDVSKVRTAMNRVGIPNSERFFFLSSDDYNGLARDLANRADMTGKPTEAYEESWVGKVAGIQTYELDYALSQAAALGSSITMDTRASAGNFYVPKSVTVGAGGLSPVDNRYQTITVNSTTNIKKGDAFTVVGINEVHHITHGDTGKPKTFRVALDPINSTQLVISPPIISKQGTPVPDGAEVQYQNCIVAGSGSATASLVFLNTVAAAVNPFWHREAMILTPGRMAPPMNAGAMIKRAVTDNGIEITMWQQTDIDTGETKFRFDVRFGVTMLMPEMAGIEMFGQT